MSTRKHALKVYLTEAQKKVGWREQTNYRKIEEMPHPNIVRSYAFHQGMAARR
jgi:hypothetical protein